MLDLSPLVQRNVILPEDLITALAQNAAAPCALAALPISHQRKYAIWIKGAKKADNAHDPHRQDHPASTCLKRDSVI